MLGQWLRSQPLPRKHFDCYPLMNEMLYAKIQNRELWMRLAARQPVSYHVQSLPFLLQLLTFGSAIQHTREGNALAGRLQPIRELVIILECAETDMDNKPAFASHSI